MINVKYDILNGHSSKEEELQLKDLPALEEWIFGQMRRPFGEGNAMDFPTPEGVRLLGANGPWAIGFTPVRGKGSFRIHMISDDRGIVFSDGEFTSGQKHWSQEVQDWLRRCVEHMEHPHFNFVP